MIRKVFAKNQGNIFMSWLKSYILILLIPLVITSFAYYQSINVIEEEIDKAHLASLKQLRQVIDEKLRDVEKMTLEIGWGEKNNTIMYLKDDFDPMQKLSVINLIKDFKVYGTALGFIDYLYVYYKNGDFILSRRGTSSVKDFYSFYVQPNGISYDEWFKTISSIHTSDYMHFGKNGSMILFLQSLPIEDPESAVATIAISLNEDFFRSEIDKTKWLNEGNIYIIDSDNNIIASTSQTALPKEIEYGKLNKESDIFYAKSGNKEYAVSYTASGVNNWRYISTIPTSVFLQKAKYVRKVIYITIFLCILIGLIISYIFTRKNYTPVRRLVQIFGSKKEEQHAVKHIGYDFIEESILNIIGKNEEISQRLEHQNHVLRDNFLCRLLKGHVANSISVSEALNSYDIEFDGDDFSVMIFYFEDLNGHFFEKLKDKTTDSFEIGTDKIKDFIRAELPVDLGYYAVGMDGMICCLINISASWDGDLKRELTSVAQKTVEFSEKSIGVYMAAAASSRTKSIRGITDAYQEAMEVIEHKRLLGGGQIMHYDDINQSNHKKNNYYGIEEKQFVNCLKGEDYKTAKTVLDNILRENFYEACISSQVAKYRMYGLMNIIFYTIKECSLSFDKNLSDELKLEQRLLDCKTVKELQNQTNEIIDQMELYSEERKNENDFNHIEEIKKFINKNYQDANLSISFIADKFGMNGTYFSRYFKKQTGWGPLEYMHKIRIDKSKELLKEQHLSIKDASTKVGYYNSIAFIRAFKKYEGITPGKYIEMQEQ